MTVASTADADLRPAALVANAARVAAAMRTAALPLDTRAGAMAAYHVGWRGHEGVAASPGAMGKLLRGALCLWAAEAVGGDPDAAMPAAVAIEWVHNFTLVHDDIQDGDRERRGRPTVWSLWGPAQAINAGDAMQAHAFRVLAAADATPARRLRALQLLGDAVVDVIDGQCADLDLEGCIDVAPSRYMRMIRSKTGALFGAALACGGALGGASARSVEALAEAGRLLGAAFQVRDDWLGTFGDPSRTGKSGGNDLARRKLTHVVLSVHAAADEPRRERLRALFARDDPHANAELRELVEELGGRDLAACDAVTLADDAVACAAAAGITGQYLRTFAAIARYAVGRVA